ncbi:MAG: hypothetical protein EHM62_04200 [Methylococcus sp.]|nr:MAG: hypothetical protein EHM62_04200 [Methylococcus sp.]
MTGCLHLIHSLEGFHACRLRAGPRDTLVLMRPSALPASLPPTPTNAAHPAVHWLDPADPRAQKGHKPADPAITAIDIQELVRLTEQYHRIVTWD